ncbi:single-stranded DNA-binding protein [Tomitella gaofuii]|uniref:single-stranded DNA-binding protein n=1 Tax=Tomitella gaofuii TaxID=2760083 RepID=UPI0015FA20C1|nr:single-stranded DNA-binding protein [Tomitella gaofuii]
MFETYMTVIGNVANKPDRRDTPAGEVVSFRLGSTARYWSEEDKSWRDGSSLFLTVNCWRRLVNGVALGVVKGAPVIAHGPVRLREYTTQEGQRRSVMEMRAVSVGLDLARCLAERVDQQRRSGPADVAEPGGVHPAREEEGTRAAPGRDPGAAGYAGLPEAPDMPREPEPVEA